MLFIIIIIIIIIIIYYYYYSSSIDFTTYLPFYLIYPLDMWKKRLWLGIPKYR